MKTFKLALSLGLCLCAAAVHGDDSTSKSVVRIFTTAQNVDYYEPWKPGSQYQIQGSGCILPDGRILTTARMVNKGHYIEVQKFGDTKRAVAKVEQLGYDLDLAILTVQDKDFFTGTKPVEFGGLPSRGDKLLIQGADEVSTKEDSVSAMNMVWGEEGGRFVPAILTNGPIDPLNDGCPVFHDGKLVGIPFDATGKPDKTGSILPINVIQRFFEGFAGGKSYDGFPDLGFYTQDLENASLRDYFKAPAKQEGEIISKILYGGSADGILKEGDVLTAIDGHAIDNDGYINLKKVGRIPEFYLATFYKVGDSVSLDIYRDGKAMKISMPLKPIVRLLPQRNDNLHPSYFVMAGFVFVPLTVNYFSTGSWDSFKPELQDLFFHGIPTPEQKQVVIISHVLPHEINQGYDKQSNLQVEKVNGQPITEMKDLLTAFANPQGKNDIIEVDDFDWFGSTIIVDAEKAKAATAEILKTFKIPADRSKDLQ